MSLPVILAFALPEVLWNWQQRRKRHFRKIDKMVYGADVAVTEGATLRWIGPVCQQLATGLVLFSLRV
jgi:hypothetical protein